MPAVSARLTPEERRELARPRPVDPEAYQLYVHGRFLWNKQTGEAVNQSITDFQKALAKDPNFALAYAGLADIYAALPYTVGTPAGEAYQKAEEMATKALAIDGNLVEAVNVLAEVAEYSWKWPAAERLFQHALKLNPSYTQTCHDYGFYLLVRGRFQEAMEWGERSCLLDPLSNYFAADLASIFYTYRQYDEAIRRLKKVQEMDSRFALTYAYLALAYGGKRDYKSALAAAKRVLIWIRRARHACDLGLPVRQKRKNGRSSPDISQFDDDEGQTPGTGVLVCTHLSGAR